ncbi:hypothetical protein DFH09DRAFT_1100928 [Mycena vulgaris]|nr:hypothetical protein DFH09DRAFT_1100928 [Mycena vulgaris]
MLPLTRKEGRIRRRSPDSSAVGETSAERGPDSTTARCGAIDDGGGKKDAKVFRIKPLAGPGVPGVVARFRDQTAVMETRRKTKNRGLPLTCSRGLLVSDDDIPALRDSAIRSAPSRSVTDWLLCTTICPPAEDLEIQYGAYAALSMMSTFSSLMKMMDAYFKRDTSGRHDRAAQTAVTNLFLQILAYVLGVLMKELIPGPGNI